MTRVDRKSPTADDGGPCGPSNGRLGVAWRIALVFLVATLGWLLILRVNRVAFGPGYDRLGHVVWACIGFHLAFQTVQQLSTGPWASDAFIVSASGTLERAVFGLVPLALAVSVLELVVGEDTDWSTRHPDTVPMERDRSG